MFEKQDLMDRICRLSVAMDPEPTGTTPIAEPLANIKSVCFDIYGTLLISGSGEVGTLQRVTLEESLERSLCAVGLIQRPDEVACEEGVRLYRLEIQREHERRRKAGVAYPEVDICRIWERVLRELLQTGEGDRKLTPAMISRVAVEFECRSNPVWPMPGLKTILSSLKLSGLALGIVSNAQFYTSIALEALLGSSIEALGFQPKLQRWSYQSGEAKPSVHMFESLLSALREEYRIGPSEVLYVGNDMLNDIYSASTAGCRTVLFAGDGRSLRLRADDPVCVGINPDRVITDLRQLLKVVPSK